MTETPHNDTPLGLRMARTVAWISGVFSLVVCVLIIANFVQTRRLEPLESPALTTMIADLADSPKDQQLKEEIRALDLLARKAFFSSRELKKLGAYLLIGSIAILFISLRLIMSYQKTIPMPGIPVSKSAELNKARWNRWAIVGAFGILVVTSVVLSFTKESAPTAPVPTEERAVANTEPPPSQKPAPAAIAFPSPEEMKQNWPAFRGYRSLGYAYTKGAPTQWDGATGTNLRWKVEVPRPGYSSPIVWKDRVFLTGGDDAVREVFCYATDSGKMIWRHDVTGIEGSPAQAPKVTPDTGHAASTPTTNGSAIFAIFSTGDVISLDFDGKRIWARNLGLPKNHYGHSSSLLTWENLLLVQYDHGTSGSLLALDQSTGQTKWETKRDTGISWASPIIANTGNRDEVILTANPLVAAYDPKTGNNLWQVSCLSGEVGPSAAYLDGHVFAVNEYAILAAISLPSLEITWETDYDLSEVSSPLAFEKHLFLATSDGAITCFDAKTGNRIWQEFFDYGFYASPVLAENNIYLIDNSGTMHVFKASATYEAISHSPLGEDSFSTPAIVDGTVYCRGIKHLFCLGTP